MPDLTSESEQLRPGDLRPGGRSARVRQSAFDAALGLLVDEGPRALTIDAIAARSGVHKTTLYRRWGSASVIMREALWDYDEVAIQQRAIPDSGSLLGDLRAVATIFGSYLEEPVTKAVLGMIISEGPRDPELSNWATSFWLSRTGPFLRLIERAVERAELHEDTQPGDVAEPLIGPMLLRTLVTGFPLDAVFLEDLAVLVFHGLRARMEKQ